MMYVNLILRNLRRSVKEYVIYIATLSISIMLIFAYNGLIYSPQLAVLNERLVTFEAAIIVFTVLIVLIVAWLIYYISNFILQKRSKEFGMYLLMGMTRRQVSFMFLAEQFVLSLLAFGIGCLLGTFAMQIMLIIIVGMLQQDYVLEIGISMQNVKITALYFMVIFVIEFAREYHALMKHKIYDLLYSEKKNETIKQNKALSYLYCFFALLFFIIGYVCLKVFLDYVVNLGEGGFSYLLISLSALIFSVYFWFFGISSLLTRFMNARKNIKYRGNTMYVYAQIAGRLRSNRAILATLSILTLSTLIFLCLGFKMNEMQNDIEGFFPFDINAMAYETLDVSSIQTYLEEEGIAYQDYMYATYEMPEVHFSLFDNIANEFGYFDENGGTYIAASDYNALRKLKGKEEIAMKDSEYILLVDKPYRTQIEKHLSNEPLTIKEENLSFHSMDLESLGQSRLKDIAIIVIPDSLVTNASQTARIYNVKTEIPSTSQWTNHFEEQFQKDNPQNSSFADVQADWIIEQTFSILLMNLCLYYFAIIFTCVSATILATQQLSDSAKQRYAYAMLWRMGVSKKELFALMRKQLAFYFFVPMMVPLLYAFPILTRLNDMFQNTYAQASMIPYFFMSLLFYFIINMGYYLLAYYGCKQTIKECL